MKKTNGDPRQRRKRGEKQREGGTKRVKKYDPGEVKEEKKGKRKEEKRKKGEIEG